MFQGFSVGGEGEIRIIKRMYLQITTNPRKPLFYKGFYAILYQ